MGHANQLREGSDEVSTDSEQARASAVREHAPEEDATPSDKQGTDAPLAGVSAGVSAEVSADPPVEVSADPSAEVSADPSAADAAVRVPVAPPLPGLPSLSGPPKVGAPLVPPLFGGKPPAPSAGDAPQVSSAPPSFAPVRPGFVPGSPVASSVHRDKSRLSALLQGARGAARGSAAQAIETSETSPAPEAEVEAEVEVEAEAEAAEASFDDGMLKIDDFDAGVGHADDDVDLGDYSDHEAQNVEDDLEEGRPVTTSFDVDLGDAAEGFSDSGMPSEGTVVTGTPAPEEPKTGQLTPRRDALFGTVLADRYRVLDLIGKGGMGKVYLAEHVAIGKKVAIKVLSQAYCHRPDQVKRFLREARAASTIDHENVIDITDFGEMPNGSVFFAMEYLQGEDVSKLLRRHGRLSWPRARRIILQICRALQAAHGRGIIHRDVKPENCFLITRGGRRDFVKVLDFGIAKVVDEDRKVSHTLTQAGALIGTPEYMAPEQVTGEVADPRMDIYSIGCIMYQLLTGRLPFSDKTMFGVLTQQVNMKPPPLREVAPAADIPEEVEAIVLKAMEKTKEARYQTMLEMVEAIAAAPRGTAGSHGDRAMTMGTSNLAAAAAEARKIAEAHLAGHGQAGTSAQSGVSPHLTGAHAALSASAALSTSTASTGGAFPAGLGGTGPYPSFGSDSQPGIGSWDQALDPSTTASILAGDPKLLFRLAIGLGVVVLVLLIVLLYMLVGSSDTEEEAETSAVEITAGVVAGASQGESAGDSAGAEAAASAASAAASTGDDGTSSTTGESSTTTAAEAVAEPEVEPVPEPVEPTQRPKNVTKKKKTKAVEPAPSGIVLPNLDLREVSQAMGKIQSDVERCKSQYSDPAKVKIDVTFSGGTGRVTKAVPVTGNPKVAACIVKAIKRKVRVSRFDKTSASSRRTF